MRRRWPNKHSGTGDWKPPRPDPLRLQPHQLSRHHRNITLHLIAAGALEDSQLCWCRLRCPLLPQTALCPVACAVGPPRLRPSHPVFDSNSFSRRLSPSRDGHLFLYLHLSDPTHGLAWRVLRKSYAVIQHSTHLNHAQGKPPFDSTPAVRSSVDLLHIRFCKPMCRALRSAAYIHTRKAFLHCVILQPALLTHSSPALPKLHPSAGQWPASLMPLLSLWGVLSASFGSLSGLGSRIEWKRRPLMRQWRSKSR